MITDTNFFIAKEYTDEFFATSKKNSSHLDFAIAVYNFNHKDKLVRKSCGCDYGDKFRVISIWLNKSIKQGNVIQE